MATAPSANDLTRQQLDELDALLQRMLNLPLTGTEPPPAPTGPTWRYDAPAAPPAPTPHLAAPPEPPLPQPGPAIFTPAPAAPAPPLVAPLRPQPVAEVPPPRPEPVAAPVPLLPPPEPATPIIERKPTPPSAKPVSKPTPKPAAPVAAAPAAAAPAPVVVEPHPPLPLLLWPLAAVDWVFGALMGLLGPPGWLLRSGFGKNVLGLTGIGAIAYTAAHLATEAGWVQIPFAVPWPR